MNKRKNLLTGFVLCGIAIALAFASCSLAGDMDDLRAMAGGGGENQSESSVSIVGDNWVKGTLTAKVKLPGTEAINYEWQREGVPIGGAAGATYTIVSADVDKNLTVTVNRTGSGVFITSNEFKVSDFTGIYTQAELANISGDASNYILANNIEIQGTTWERLFSTGDGYKGIFDGNGRTIAFGTKTSSGFTGLFGIIGSIGVVKNLRLTGSFTVTASGLAVCGTVASYNYGTIRNVSSSIKMTVTSSEGNINPGLLGGIAGYTGRNTPQLTVAIIENCYNTGTLTYSRYDGTTSSSIGGISGDLWYGKINNCWSSGEMGGLNLYGAPYVGGIVGNICMQAALLNNESQVNNCVALGTLIRCRSIDGTPYGGRISSRSSTAVKYTYCYANSAMTVSSSKPTDGLTADRFNGEDVTVAVTEGSNGSWWTGTKGPGWTSSLNWGGIAANENKPWKWDGTNKRPILWFESRVNQ